MQFLIRYGEIALKSTPVRRRMETILLQNIALAFGKTHISLRRSYGRIFLEAPSGTARRVLPRVFGIISFSPCLSCNSEIPSIIQTSLILLKKTHFRTFAVHTRRAGSHTFSSQDVNIAVGDAIRTTLRKNVDLTHPDITVFIEVRDEGTYLYMETIPGPGGLPLGSQGKILVFIENKRDMLAGWLFMRRGCSILPVSTISLLPLEKWAFRPLKLLSTEKALRKALGIATSQNKKMEKLKKEYSLPVYNPLLGMGKTEISALLKKVFGG